MPRNPDAYVRAMKPAELPQVIDLLTRAFINDPTMCYYGHVSALVQDPANPTPSHAEAIRDLRVFWNAMARIPLHIGGNIDVVVAPSSSTNGSADHAQGSAAPAEEQIVAVALWLPPGTSLDFSLATLLRAEFHKVPFVWGFTGSKRLIEFTPAVEKTLKREFKSRKVDRLDTWHVWAIAVDPEHQGAGYSSMLFRHGFRRASPKVIHLVASKPKNKDIYEHFGFETVETHIVGVGKVDAAGLKASGDAAKGVPEFVMIKWTS
ncbi:hypothetical protein DICSQDRAFT_141221 [Dichomitus squalens LYAD-421 SS1]|uniref:N-acetyltransferase domain-containing protein n=1 Tax=Dichomitus squalens (strain LYAD-421) TaxID=732165 RepID=R7SKX0_DICSQ|nr:uncharacterized protein DICSQDRAFT_141221 [Dichomitus squalens LYAD-421 SS1]EJF56518.1 hypothetical protein DICSQDRAFT_141221 [Dichomitus squalens LYAD-421 SS1]